MNKRLKSALAVILMVLLCFGSCFATGCSKKSKVSLADRLAALDGVVSVTPIEVTEYHKPSNRFQERYLVKFEQPIDWKHPELGTFTQRVFLGYAKNADVTCYNTGGYFLGDVLDPDYLQKCDAEVEYISKYNLNYVEIEYRFFAESVPEGLSATEERYWEYMTAENASGDFHHIITELGKVLGGSTIFYGHSKGGSAVESMACLFPDDIDAYVSYVAPLCDGTNDDRLYENLYTTIGDKDPAYGAEKAAKYRQIVLDYQLKLLEPDVRKVVQPEVMDYLKQCGWPLSPLVSEDEAYEAAVADLPTFIWQYMPVFGEMERELKLPETPELALVNKIGTIGNRLIFSSLETTITCKSPMTPYFIQSFIEMGNYTIDLSYLREAGAELKTRPEDEASLAIRMCAPVLWNSSLKYSDQHKNKVIRFMDTTDKEIIKIVGLSDPWYAVSQVTNNEHIHLFEVSATHDANPNCMTEEDRTEFYAILDRLLGR